MLKIDEWIRNVTSLIKLNNDINHHQRICLADNPKELF
ncbi:hypothetical protein AOR13_1026 [Alteromonas stellipolaris LMG 21856]|nr:hypothetical protein AOR13_1026 [Alteromonas stellipolaris LMG 21856]